MRGAVPHQPLLEAPEFVLELCRSRLRRPDLPRGACAVGVVSPLALEVIRAPTLTAISYAIAWQSSA